MAKFKLLESGLRHSDVTGLTWGDNKHIGSDLSIMLSNEEDEKPFVCSTKQKLPGHTNINSDQVYVDVLLEIKLDAVSQMDKFFG